MMKVVGEEGTSLADYIIFQKSEFLDSVYLQQDSFDPIDGSVGLERQKYIFNILYQVLEEEFTISSKTEARSFFNQLRQKFLDWNGTVWDSEEFTQNEESLVKKIREKLQVKK